ncbi:Calcipressin-2 [Chionoecetes opilio]|uniref:Calcipressin-2 n=1 Tax=Chionoecetes opilio TaxID=41210 RepID=A0A8J4YAL8_CHIOP|nr:Calcipressin-2 [Chionoecetes opilio]
MLIEELHMCPAGEEGEAAEAYEAGGGGEEGAGVHDQGLEGGAQGEEDGDCEASQEPITSIIVTNLTLETFEHTAEREKFESLFHEIDETVNFQYFKSFRRVRVNFATAEQANRGRDKIHMTEFNGEVIKGYFTQPIVVANSRGGDPHLQPPKRDKQFLISPPASPPVGWEPILEAQPLVNYDLITAVANLAPGESHELHPPIEDKPGIIVHVCEECQICEQGGARPRIIQTRRPPNDT